MSILTWEQYRTRVLNLLDLAESELSDEDYSNLLGDLQTDVDSRIRVDEGNEGA